ncbi:hypothetical protein IT157_09925 [bacterium]|nr:hypothetical protein [bacterium]
MMLRLLAMMLVATSQLFAEGTPPVALFYTFDGSICDQGLNKGTPIPDGSVVKVYWDLNGNGPDEKDFQPAIGSEAENVNWNTYVINSDSLIKVKGMIATDPGFCVVGLLPDVPRYYFRICLDGKSLTSDVFTLVSGLQEFNLKNWYVGPACKNAK